MLPVQGSWCHVCVEDIKMRTPYSFNLIKAAGYRLPIIIAGLLLTPTASWSQEEPIV